MRFRVDTHGEKGEKGGNGRFRKKSMHPSVRREKEKGEAFSFLASRRRKTLPAFVKLSDDASGRVTRNYSNDSLVFGRERRCDRSYKEKERERKENTRCDFGEKILAVQEDEDDVE